MRRTFLHRSTGILGAIVSTTLLFQAGTSRGAEKPVRQAAIFRDASLPPVAFAAGEIRRALQGLGFTVEEKPWEEIGEDRSPVRILLPVANPKTARGRVKEFAQRQGKSLGNQGYLLRIK